MRVRYAAALALVLLTLACGRYGPPERRPQASAQPAAEVAPVTDPAVPAAAPGRAAPTQPGP